MLIGETLDQDFNIQYYFNNVKECVEKKLADKKIYLPIKARRVLKYLLVENVENRPSVQEVLGFVSKLDNRYQIDEIATIMGLGKKNNFSKSHKKNGHNESMNP